MDLSLLTTLILGLIGFVITAFYSWRTNKLAHEQMMKQLFTEFNKRYSDLNDYLNEIESKYYTLEELEKAENYKELKQKVVDYFSLCAEEFYWFHHKKRIDKIIWKSWQSGMNYWYQKVPAIHDLWMSEIKSNGRHSYYIHNTVEFFEEAKK